MSDGKRGQHKIPRPVVERIQELVSSEILPNGANAEAYALESFHNPFPKLQSSPSNGIRGGQQRCAEKGRGLVDVSLELMGFQATAVWRTTSIFLVDILMSLLRSAVYCDRFFSHASDPLCTHENWTNLRSEEYRQHSVSGRNLSASSLQKIVENCVLFLSSDRGQGAQSLAETLLLAATQCREHIQGSGDSSFVYKRDPGNRYQIGSTSDREFQRVLNLGLEKRESIYSNLQPLSRLHSWRLCPSSLKEDISGLAEEAMKRPLWPLKRNLHHSVRLWEVRAELAAAVQDAINCPSSWGFSAEVYLPPLYSFYRISLRPFVRILNSPPTERGLAELLTMLDAMESGPDLNHLGYTVSRPATNALCREDNFVLSQSPGRDHNSVWALLMDFWPWFNFAMSQLFYCEDEKEKTTTSQKYLCENDLNCKGKQISSDASEDHSTTAAKYVAWIISPNDADSRSSKVSMLLCMSSDWKKVIQLFKKANALGDSCKAHGSTGHTGLCSVCGLSGQRVKRQKLNSFYGKEDKTMALYQTEAKKALMSWLANLELNLKGTSQSIASGLVPNKGKDPGLPFCDRTDTQTSTEVSCSKKELFLLCSLPLAAMAATFMHCRQAVVEELMLFVARGGNLLMDGNESARSLCNRCVSESHCNMCCPEHSVKLKTKSTTWVWHAATIFKFLDSIEELYHNLDDSKLTRMQNTFKESLAVTVAGCIMMWIKSSEFRPFDETCHELHKDRHLCLLEDLRTRYCAWIEDGELTFQASWECASALRGLDAQISFLKDIDESHGCKI